MTKHEYIEQLEAYYINGGLVGDELQSAVNADVEKIKVNIAGNQNLMPEYDLDRFIAEGMTSLMDFFVWEESPEGMDYWYDRWLGRWKAND